MIKTILRAAFCLLFFGALAHAQVIPSDRNFAWNPGMMSKGGIPNRSTICATLSPSGGDDSAAIQAKLDTCPSNQVVMLNPGTFTVNNLLLIHSPITLRGSGAGVTILKKTNGARARTSQVVAGTNGILTPVDPASYNYDAQPVIIVGPNRWPVPDNSTSQNLTADGQQGAFSVTVANGSGFAAGQFVLLDELSGATYQSTPVGYPQSAKVLQGDRVAWTIHNPSQPVDDPDVARGWFCRYDRATNEIKEIASVAGNVITFTSPLSISYRTSHTAQLTRYTNADSNHPSIHVTNAGVENLTTIGGADGEIRFENTAYSWAKNVEVTQWIGEGIAVDGSFRVEVRDSYIHTGSWPEPGGTGYSISVANGSSEALIENNISIDVNKVMVFRSSGAGSVVAYNYTDDGWIFGTEDWIEAGINASHMAGPHHVLFEGNYSFNIDSDYTHGNAIYITFFRNWLAGVRRDFPNDVNNNKRTVGLAYGSWWDSFIGNVFGRSGQMAGYTYTDPAMSCDANGNNCTGNNANWTDQAIWSLGYDAGAWDAHADPQTLSTIIRDGNYDFLTNSQRWHNTPGGFAIPNSMYLSSKPAFFGSNPWPWVVPSNGTIYILPAKARYDAGTPNDVATNPRATATALSSSQNPSVSGAPVTFTATVSVASGTPTGTVTFKDGATTLGTGTLSGGTATFSTSALAIGSHTITAIYGGDTNFDGSTSTAVTQTVMDPRTSTTALSSSQNPSLFGASVTFTATVSAASGTPTGTVTFNDGATTLGTGTLSGGTATYSTSSLAVGSHAITAVYGGDTNFNGSTSTAVTQTVATTAAPPNDNFANAITIQAGQTLTGSNVNATNETGEPNILGSGAGKSVWWKFTAPASGSFNVNTIGSNFDTLLGIYTGSAVNALTEIAVDDDSGTNHTSSTDFTATAGTTYYILVDGWNNSPTGGDNGNIQLAVSGGPSQQATTTTLASTPNPSVFGQSVTFTATVSAASGTPTGTVTFKNGSTTLGTGTLSGGAATYSTSALAKGNRTITAVYGGDTNFTGSTSSSLTQTVNKGATTTAVNGAPNPSVFGASVTFTATITVTAPGSGTPSGTVTFKDGATTLGTGTLASGVVTFAISSLAIGGHTITAVYGGDTNFTGSTSSGVTQTVNKGATTTAVNGAPNPSTFGASVTFTATITVTAPASGTPSGTVTFKDGATTLGTGTLTGGVATLPISSLAIGSHSITAVYGGDTNFAGSTSTAVTQTVNKGATTTAVSSSQNPSVFGASVTLTATITATAPASGTPSGTVTFKDGATTLGTGTLTGGVATLPISSLAIGSHSITAVYGGDSNFTGSTSSGLTQTVNAAPTLQVSPSSNIVASGNQGGPFLPSSFQYQLSASSGSVDYSISGLPTWLDVSSASGTVTTSPTTITFTVNASANSLVIGTYSATISFANTSNGQGNQTRNAALQVNSSGVGSSYHSRWRGRRF